MRRLVLAVAVAACLVGPAGPAAAHPLGNFTTNTAAAVVVTPQAIAVDYVVDLAEIPALRVVQRIDGDEDGYRRRECAALAEGVTLTFDGRRLPVRVDATELTLPPGEAGLTTLRLECSLVAEIEGWSQGERTVTFADANLDGRIGWREVTALGRGATLVASDVPARSVTDQLRSYPPERLAAPLDVRAATLRVRPRGPTADLPDGGQVGPARAVDDAFTGLIGTRELTLAVAMVAVAAALGLGALHALAPGHGKTVMAAYLLSREAGTRQIAALAVTVAAAHTLGVLILGAALGLTEIVAPQRLYAWLGIASGLLFAAVGLTLLRQARHVRAHHHHGHGHEHRPPGWRGLVAPGLAGGLVPTPSALVVLLGGIALNRTWFGILLVVAYGCGMGAALVAAGWALSRARDHLATRATSGRLTPLMAALPTVTACLLVITGLALAARAAVAL